MRKILAVIMIAFVFSCETEPPIEEKIIPIDRICPGVPIWCENDSITLIFDNNTKH